jgi:hypothetical protein
MQPLATIWRQVKPMMPTMLRLSLGVLALVLCSCASSGSDVSPTPELPRATNRPKAPSPTIHIDRGPGKPMTLTGTLGMLQVEGGCPYLETDKGSRYEVIYRDGWYVDKSTGELIDPTGDVSARPGDTVTVRGEVAIDAVSICQIGRIFRADEVIETKPR